MDTFTLVASIVLLGFIAWALARILGRGDRSGGDGRGPEAGSSATWSGAAHRRESGHGTDAGHADDGGGGD